VTTLSLAVPGLVVRPLSATLHRVSGWPGPGAQEGPGVAEAVAQAPELSFAASGRIRLAGVTFNAHTELARTEYELITQPVPLKPGTPIVWDHLTDGAVYVRPARPGEPVQGFLACVSSDRPGRDPMMLVQTYPRFSYRSQPAVLLG